MKNDLNHTPKGFTLLETVIAIGVLAVLLSGFLVVFAPAAAGVRQSINVQQADRLASALEEEMGVLRDGEATASIKTAFDKAFDWIQNADTRNTAILVYQYRGSVSSLRRDQTPTPERDIEGKSPGKDYVLVPMARRANDGQLNADLGAVDGAVYLVKATQLVPGNNGMRLGSKNKIENPNGGGTAANADAYTEAVIAFAAEFHLLPSRDPNYLRSSAFNTRFNTAKNPVFVRNLAVRR